MFALNIAQRFLSSDKGQTLGIMLGIAIGVAVQVFVGSLIQGLQVGLVDNTVGAQPQVIINSLSDEGQISDWETICNQIDTQIEGITKIVPTIDAGSFIMKVDDGDIDDPYPILLRGFDLDLANQIYNYYNEDFIGTKPTRKNEVIIGTNIQENLELSLNQNITIQENPSPVLQKFNLTVVGYFDIGVASLNELWVLTPNETVSNIYQFNGNITSINIQIEDYFEADIIAQQISNVLNDETIEVTNWKTENQSLLDGLQGQTASSYMIQAFVLVSVVIGIGSVLAITVLQKSKQIGILKAMGVTDSTAAQIFVFEGLLLGIGGAILGVGIGIGLGWAFTTFALDSNGDPIVDLLINPVFIAGSAIIAVVASMFSALIPARKSTKVTIIEVIRNG